MIDDKDRWIKSSWYGGIVCPICDCVFEVWDDKAIKKYRHCPHCGTRLYPPKEEDD